jgi:hypothetical protein
MPPIVQLLEKASKQAVWKDPQAQQAALGSLLPALAGTPARAKATTPAVQARRWFELADPLVPLWWLVTRRGCAGHRARPQADGDAADTQDP